MKLIQQYKIKLFYLLASVLLISVLVIFYINFQKVRSASASIDNTQDVLRKNDNVLLDLLNIETSSRGFVLSKNQSFLEPYYSGVAAIKTDLDDLASLSKANSAQLIRVDSLKKYVNERLLISGTLVKMTNEGTLNGKTEIDILSQGKKLTESCRELIAAIKMEEFQLLKQGKNESVKSNTSSTSIFFILVGIIVLIFAMIVFIIRNQRLSNDQLEASRNSQKLLASYSLSLIEASLDPLVTISTNGKIMDVNEASINITGVSREKLIGTYFSGYFTEPGKANEVYQQVFDKGFVADYPLTVKHTSGKLTDVLFNGSEYKDNEGKVLGIVIVARDIAEQKWAKDLRTANVEMAYQNSEKEKRAAELLIANKELQFQSNEKEKRAAELVIANEELLFQTGEKEKRAAELVIAGYELDFQNKEKQKREIVNKELETLNDAAKLASQYSNSLIEASRDPLFTISPQGKIMDLNQATVRVTELTRKELIGTDFSKYFTDPQKAKESYEEVFEKGYVTDYPLTIMDGVQTPVLFNGSVYKDTAGNVMGAVVVARDITEQKRYQKELTEARVFAELATEIAEVAKEKAETATRNAIEAVKAKQQFLSNMSHEIRTPMNAIIGFTKVVLKTDLTVKQKEYLSAIKLSGDALIVLINDILDLAKVDAGKMIFEQTPFKMALSIAAMLHIFETKIQEKNLELVKEYDSNIPEVLIGDPVRLHQIILNLVSNAVKFTSKGKITVSVRLLKEDDEKATIEFSVKDTGIGIAEDKISKIFENFQQASSGTSRIYGGTGLGLAIVKQLVEPQGGKINVSSKLNEGSVFSFVLDFQKTNEKPELENIFLEMDPGARNIKVLVVEDIALNQLLMKTLLDEFGFERDIAANGKIAIEKLACNSYDIILMDLQMPEMNGFDATEYIRHTLKSDIPIIALTADVTTVDLAKCKAVGMNDYIAKPVDEKILYNKIVGLVKQKAKVNMEVSSIGELLIKAKCIDLDYLIHHTKSNPKLMMEMISLYLEQTPPLLNKMKLSFQEKDWASLYSAVHKMIPSFSIVGISTDFENMAKKIQEYAKTQQQTDGIPDMVLQIENICTQACIELTEEFNRIKMTNS